MISTILIVWQNRGSLKPALRPLYIFVFISSIFLSANAYSQSLGEGGSNYIAFGLPSSVEKGGENWRDSSLFKTPACQLNQNQSTVSQELRSMRENGQRKIALVLWFMHQSGSGACTGFALNSASGKLNNFIMVNLQNFVKIAQAEGFDEVEIRFAPLVRNSPREWTSWNSSMFQEDWNVIDQVRMALASSNSIKVTYDLGVELGGVEEEHCSQCSQYTRILWQRYTKKFGADDTYGFSLAYRKGRLTRLISILRSDGYPQPPAYAIDIYSKIFPGIMEFANEARRSGVSKPHFLIQETNYDDQQTLEQLIKAAQNCNCDIVGVMQWPIKRGAAPKTLVPRQDKFVYRSSR